MKAKVYRSASKEFLCKILDSKEMVKAYALTGLLDKSSIVPGDFVKLEKSKDGYRIKEVEERKNEIFRRIVREGKKKVTAANCDFLVIVTSVSKPVYKRGIVDRFLMRACQWGVEAVVVFNKMDEYDEKLDIVFERDRLQSLGTQCFEISAKYSSYQNQYFSDGFSQFKQKLLKRTAIFLGQSGVGKSKSINALTDGRINLKTKETGKMNKGVHTTTWSEIIEVENFTLMDSPGIRSFSLDDLKKKKLLIIFQILPNWQLDAVFPIVTTRVMLKNVFSSHYLHMIIRQSSYFHVWNPSRRFKKR